MVRNPDRFRRIVVLASVMLAACGRSSAKQTQDASEALRSWSATVKLVEDVRVRGAVPDGFAHQVRRAAVEERAKAEAALREARSR